MSSRSAALLDALQAARGRVILSGYPSLIYDRALAGWNRIEKATHADGARKRVEVLWCNFKGSQMDMFAADTLQYGAQQ